MGRKGGRGLLFFREETVRTVNQESADRHYLSQALTRDKNTSFLKVFLAHVSRDMLRSSFMAAEAKGYPADMNGACLSSSTRWLFYGMHFLLPLHYRSNSAQSRRSGQLSGGFLDPVNAVNRTEDRQKQQSKPATTMTASHSSSSARHHSLPHAGTKRD